MTCRREKKICERHIEKLCFGNSIDFRVNNGSVFMKCMIGGGGGEVQGWAMRNQGLSCLYLKVGCESTAISWRSFLIYWTHDEGMEKRKKEWGWIDMKLCWTNKMRNWLNWGCQRKLRLNVKEDNERYRHTSRKSEGLGEWKCQWLPAVSISEVLCRLSSVCTRQHNHTFINL